MPTTRTRTPRRDLQGANRDASPMRKTGSGNNHTEPFLKWAGGKAKLIAKLAEHLPPLWNGDYYEPFMGSAAFFFYLKSRGLIKGNAYLGDTNPSLVNCFQRVQDNPKKVIARLEEHRTRYLEGKREYYEAVRANHTATGIESAARFIFLNRTCFNGLWRVNSKGHFNVPMGRYSDPLLGMQERILQASRCLEGAIITLEGFNELALRAMPGSLIYFDPPYDPLNKTSAFTAYTTQGFKSKQQHKLIKLALTLHRERACFVMISNSQTRRTLKWYKDRAFTINKDIRVRRAISASSSARKVVDEIIVTTYEKVPAHKPARRRSSKTRSAPARHTTH